MQRAFKKIIERLEETSINDIQMVVSEVLLKYGFPKESVVQDEIWDELDGLSTSKQAIDIVNQVASEYGGVWIPCSERLPDKSGWYLCTQEYHSLKDGKVVKVTTELVEFYNNEWRRAKNLIVTHWQPLPEPYKAESEE